MAIDTAAKRSSASGDMLPFPDGAVSTADRLHYGGLYAGIGAVEVAPPGTYNVVRVGMFVPGGATHGVYVPGGVRHGVFVPGGVAHGVDV